MGMRAVRLLVSGVSLLAVGASSAGGGDAIDDPHPFGYQSEVSPLRYGYSTDTGRADGDVSGFVIETDHGKLIGRISVADLQSRVVIQHDETGTRSIATWAESGEEGIADAHLSFPERDEHVFVRIAKGDPASPELVAGRGPDCPSLEHSPWYLAQKDALRRLLYDYGLTAEAPRHLVQIAAAIGFTRSLVTEGGGCLGFNEPAAGRCHAGYSGFDECSACCETEADLFALVCMVGRAFCPAPWCNNVGAYFCGGLRNLMADSCLSVQCNGKPGDPGCTPAVQCGDVPGSSCWYVCGITQRSVCGQCAFPTQACCAPI